MSKAYDFIKECGVFFVLTLNEGRPAGRPFGAIMEVGEHLYLATNDMNSVHHQLRQNGSMQIIAKKADSRDWIRVSGTAAECADEALRARIFEECPRLKVRYEGVDLKHFLLFEVTVEQVEYGN
ncbi:MAG: pyridoxamine 5'-phosphate oxidase family protein [Clostridia bacterium]|nr:pyridoxamine 5'-phosphate oxidase family protein [Clostridia bacterium]MBQ6703846.1 pyridoxamine 5'-phosphate oxidase family protein [Clostridia bacterium]